MRYRWSSGGAGAGGMGKGGGGGGGDGELVWKAVEMKGRGRTWRIFFPSIGQENNIAQPKTDKWLSSPSHFS